MSEEREACIDEGKARARVILEKRGEQVLKLIAHLAEHGYVWVLAPHERLRGTPGTSVADPTGRSVNADAQNNLPQSPESLAD